MTEVAIPGGFNGLALVNKPLGISSHAVVSKLRRVFSTKKVGHAGTLDPQASGVLICGIGSATRLLTYLVGADKSYRAVIRLGQQTDTDDAAGQVVSSVEFSTVDSERLGLAVSELTGSIQQVPCSISAIKVGGKRAYALARSGETPKLLPRTVSVYRFDYASPTISTLESGNSVGDMSVEIDCSSGTYIRAIARDLGDKLGVGGHLIALERFRVGSVCLDHCSDLDDFQRGLVKETSLQTVDSVSSWLFDRLVVDEKGCQALRHGQFIGLDRVVSTCSSVGEVEMVSQPGVSDPLAVFDENTHVVALVSKRNDKLCPVMVFQHH